MSRSTALLLALALVSGCRIPGSSNEPVDPFFGRTRVPPPPTGTIPRGGSIDLSYGPYHTNPLRAAEGTPKPAATPSPGAAWTPVWQSPQLAAATNSPASLQRFSPRAEESADGSRSMAAVGPGDQILIPLAARDLSDLLPEPTARPTAESPRVASKAVESEPGNVGPVVAVSRSAPVTRTLNPRHPKDLGGMLPNAPVPQNVPNEDAESTQTATARWDGSAADSVGVSSSGSSRR